MIRSNARIHRRLIPACAVWVALAGCQTPAGAKPEERTTLHVVVTDAESGQPINQAHLTLQFRESGDVVKLKRPKFMAYSAKTNNQGRCRFLDIPKGTVHLLVTAEHHQSSGREYELNQDNQVIEVKLKKPQPLL